MTRMNASWIVYARRMGQLTSVRGTPAIDRSFKGPVPLNRSRKWTPYYTYQRAREMGPSAEPVR